MQTLFQSPTIPLTQGCRRAKISTTPLPRSTLRYCAHYPAPLQASRRATASDKALVSKAEAAVNRRQTARQLASRKAATANAVTAMMSMPQPQDPEYEEKSSLIFVNMSPPGKGSPGGGGDGLVERGSVKRRSQVMT